jgi:hypothetical protein
MSSFAARERLRRECPIDFTNCDVLQSQPAVNGRVRANADEHSFFLFTVASFGYFLCSAAANF